MTNLQADKRAAQKPAPMLTEVRRLQQALVKGIFRVLVSVGAVLVVAGTYDSYVTDQVWTIPLYWLFYGLIIFLAFKRNIAYTLRVWVLISLFYILGVVDFIEDGPGGSARVFMLMLPFLAALLLRKREGLVMWLLSTLTMTTFGVLFVTGYLSVPGDPTVANASRWITGTITLFMAGALMAIALNYFVRRLSVTIARSRKLAKDLERQHEALEMTVAERTEALARRARYLEATAEVAQGASQLLDHPEALLARVVQLINEQFGFYNTALFLIDSTGQWVELQAASSAGGQSLVAQGLRLRVGMQGIVGYVADRGEARLVADVREDTFFEAHLDLADTRSELALPLRVRGEIIGVMDVQSDRVGAFVEEDVIVLQSLADAVAVAINNARLFQQLQESVQAERRARGELSFGAWQEQLEALVGLAYVKQSGKINPAGDLWEPEMHAAIQTGQSVIDDGNPRALAVPVKVGEQVVAVLDARLPEDFSQWSADQVALLESLSAELGQALDRARLYEETQRRVTRERLTREVTTQVRESLGIETVLLTAIREIGERLGVEAEVWLGPDIASAEQTDT